MRKTAVLFRFVILSVIILELALKEAIYEPFQHLHRQLFLRKLYTSSQECPRSYDKLRFDPSKPNCRLMVTHDDYSMMSKLPKERTSVVTILRSPVDRVFSTYEFSVEVAARFLVHPNLSSATQMTRRLKPKSRGVSTLDIWPWKYLVPWMREELFARRDTRKGGRAMELREIADTYNMRDIMMPLHVFINEPLAHDIIHNGATFQVAGLTNNSCIEESHKVRHCVRKHSELGQYVLEVAKKRLDQMLYVGLTENHKESATMFADVVGAQILSQLQELANQQKQLADNVTGPLSSLQDHETEDLNNLQSATDDQKNGEVPNVENVDATNENITVAQLMEAYEVCISSLRKSQAVRRASSLKRISPAKFSKEARRNVPENVIQQILTLNSLDVELYKHAQAIFAEQQKLLIDSQSKEARLKVTYNDLQCPLLKVSLAAMALLFLLISMVLLIRSRRRTSKLKI
ncbi:hypothetical protein AMTR_s00148p00053200 [Amborella trichopoda]|uniref:Sulfotransferase n=1 Tax=Amborella trichopoda TaxID=13333 RepID=W1PEJ6_AMBTC|nr:hypothetical protein AMTR_s00148p00053200 [Amborella trichopoda]